MQPGNQEHHTAKATVATSATLRYGRGADSPRQHPCFPMPLLTSVLQGRSRLHLSYQASRFLRRAWISAGSLNRCWAQGGAGAGAGVPARSAVQSQGKAEDGGLRDPTAALSGPRRKRDRAAARWTSTERQGS